MRSAGLALAFCIALSGVGCTKCRSSGDCDKASHCDYATGECLKGCVTDEECTSKRCDMATGKCTPANVLHFDADLPDVRTTTTSTGTDGG
ncbi:MAG: hypothetical protein U1E65_12525 [Myxococcota bacterium]